MIYNINNCIENNLIVKFIINICLYNLINLDISYNLSV